MRLILISLFFIIGIISSCYAQQDINADPVKALEAYEAAEKAYKRGDLATAITQITIAEQNGPSLGKIKSLKEKILLAQQEAKEAEIRKILEKKRADSIATAQKLFKEAEQKRVADSIQKVKEEAKAEAIRIALEKKKKDSIDRAEKQHIADSIKAVKYDQLFDTQKMSVWQRDSSFTDFCNHDSTEFMYKFYPAKNVAVPTFHLMISRKKEDSFSMVYLSEIKIMENTDEYTRIQVPYTMQGDKGWIFYKQSYLEILYDHVSRSATFIPKERMNQMRSEDAINRERFTESLDLRQILSHSAEHVILYYHRAFIN